MFASDGNGRGPLPEAVIPIIPAPPNPSADTGINVGNEGLCAESCVLPEAKALDIFTLTPVAALMLLCRSIETLAKMNSDNPPSGPTPSSPPVSPNFGVIDSRKENVSHDGRVRGQRNPSAPRKDEDGVPIKAQTPIGSPEAHPTEHLHAIGANVEPLKTQHDAIARKFYSKKPPLISLEEYLIRLHKYCPMSTAVYLATGLYIHRLAIVEKVLPVTARNAHRLVLAGLRVTMKALEDQSYPHRRFAKVGGVSEQELGRLEISFCFITNFELRVNQEVLSKHAKAIREGTMSHEQSIEIRPTLPPPLIQRVVVGQTKPPAMMTQEAPATA